MAAVLCTGAVGWGQVPAAGPPPSAAPSGAPAAGAPLPAAKPAEALPAPASSQSPARSEPPPPPPPLDPPPTLEPTSRPGFLKTREEFERVHPERKLPQPRRIDEERDAAPRAVKTPAGLPKDFVVNATPWVDFSLTSFSMGERSSNFLNLGVQVGGYFAERIRLSARLIAPLEEANDEYDGYDDDFSPGGSYQSVDSRSLAVLYGASIGLILANSKTFVFAPGLLVWRADESDYGTTGALSLPFEWTTHRHLRVGFELAVGHSFGGSVSRSCQFSTTAVSCADDSITRPGGTAVLMQYAMGWALSPL